MPQLARILVPTDFSPPSMLATEYAIDMARRYGASIQLLHVLQDLAYTNLSLDGYVDLSGVHERLADDARQQLATLMRQCTAADVPTTTELVNGNPAPAIVQCAEATAPDLIVMGTHGRGGFAHLFLGSVAERVVRAAPCPVLTVRETRRIAETIAADTALRHKPALQST